MWSFLIVELLPFHSHRIQIKCLIRQIYKIPKLCLIGLLRPFNFAIQMWSPWFDRSELDKMIMQFILEIIIEEFCSPISLYPLNGKKERCSVSLLKNELYFPLFIGIYTNGPQTGTIIYGRELICSISYFHYIQLDPFPRNFFLLYLI